MFYGLICILSVACNVTVFPTEMIATNYVSLLLLSCAFSCWFFVHSLRLCVTLGSGGRGAAVHSGPALSHSGSLLWPSQCLASDVQHMPASTSFSISFAFRYC